MHNPFTNDISEILAEKISAFKVSATPVNTGMLVGLFDGIAKIHGLANVTYGECLEFSNGAIGIAMNLERDYVWAVILGSSEHLAEQQPVLGTGKLLSTPVGEALLGRVVDARGMPIDGQGPLAEHRMAPMEVTAPNVMARQSVNQPLFTGIKAIDTLVPIGKGQRELIIGDRQTGKTSMAINTIINQKHSNVRCIYVAIGQKTSSISAIVRCLTEHNAMAYTTVVAASAASPASMQYIAPYAACSMGEYFRDRGEDALIIYDDLTKHAWAYRQLSLLLRRPPGREAYPGDIFYLHSRLLERAARVNPAFVEEKTQGRVQNRSGSLTALPIIETQAGDVSAFIPTNVISITDGQIFLDTELFNAGIRPAINAGLSVSRIGGAAQNPVIKKLGGKIRLLLAQYRELEAFAQFASELDANTRKQLERGQRVVEILKQKHRTPISTAHLGLSLFAVEYGFLDNIALASVSIFEKQLHAYVSDQHPQLLRTLETTEQYTVDIETQLQAALKEYTEQQWARQQEQPCQQDG
jgi:F-type H+-transporting ATPase subunit alpha